MTENKNENKRPAWAPLCRELMADLDSEASVSVDTTHFQRVRLTLENSLSAAEIIASYQEQALRELKIRGWLPDHRTVEDVTLAEIGDLLRRMALLPSNPDRIATSSHQIRRLLEAWLWIFAYHRAIEQRNAPNAAQAMHVITMRMTTIPFLEHSVLSATRKGRKRKKGHLHAERDLWCCEAFIILENDECRRPRGRYAKEKFRTDLVHAAKCLEDLSTNWIRQALEKEGHLVTPPHHEYLHQLAKLTKETLRTITAHRCSK